MGMDLRKPGAISRRGGVVEKGDGGIVRMEEGGDVVEREEVPVVEELVGESSTDISLLTLLVPSSTDVGSGDAMVQSVVPLYQIRIRLWE
jgi:hypothetical protein